MRHLLLLHGAIGSADQLATLAQQFPGYDVHRIDLPGHGAARGDGDFSIERFAGFVARYCKERKLEAVSIFGYSMGGYVALYLAAKVPGLVQRIITLGTKFHWDEGVAAKEVAMLQPEVIQRKLPKFAAALAQRHEAMDWKEVLHRTAAMLEGLGRRNALTAADYPAIGIPVLVMLGDRDRMVTLEETVAVQKLLPDAQLAVLPGTPHPIEGADAGLLRFFIARFLD